MSFVSFAAASPEISLPGGSQAGLMLARWIHLVAGIVWIGLLYFFNLVNFPFLGELDEKNRTAVISKLMPRAMWWFRWSSVVTVLAGFGYWNVIVATDARNAVAMGGSASAGGVIGSFVLIWTVAFAVEMGVLMAPTPALKSGPVLGVTVAIIVVAASYLFLALNQGGWESNRALAIGIGGGLGWFMMLNVWGIVWRMQKKIIVWNAAAAGGATLPAEAAAASRLSFLVARVNFWLSFPMLFFMGAASHYLMFAQR